MPKRLQVIYNFVYNGNGYIVFMQNVLKMQRRIKLAQKCTKNNNTQVIRYANVNNIKTKKLDTQLELPHTDVLIIVLHQNKNIQNKNLQTTIRGKKKKYLYFTDNPNNLF